VIWVNTVIEGVLVGSFYALFACGLSLMFGVMKIINLAHGDMAVVAGYTAVFLVPKFHVAPLWSFVVVVPIFALLGYVVQRTLLQKSHRPRPLHHAAGHLRALGHHREPAARDLHRERVSRSTLGS
jgi:branched-chain amino acid transport system permease protein